MKVIKDEALCEANGRCEQEAPEVFELDDDDELHIRVMEISEDMRDKVERAISRCPRRALRLE